METLTVATFGVPPGTTAAIRGRAQAAVGGHTPQQQVSAPRALPATASAVGGGERWQRHVGAVAAVAAVLPAAATHTRRRRRAGRGVCSEALPRTIRAVSTAVPATTSTESPAWRSFGKDWEIHKFGGASLQTAELYKTCGNLLLSESKRTEGTAAEVPTAAIVSAAGGMTDALVGVVNAAVDDLNEAKARLDAAAARQKGIILELVPGRPDLTDLVVKNIEADQQGVMAMLTAASLMRGVPPQMLELVAGLGEVWSAQTLASYLSSTGVEAAWIDARDVLIVADSAAMAGLGEKGTAMDTIAIFWKETSERLQGWWKKSFSHGAGSGSIAPFLVITGFVCSTPSGRPTTLKRSGSDYSATIFAKVLGSSSVTMWKNVNGVYTADPRRVPAAFPIPRLTFDEAMELAYFGGQVLHPSAMVPCIEGRIPVLVRNVFNPSHPGTRVYGRGDARLRWEDQADEKEEDDADDMPVKAITSIEKVTLVTISGASFIGTPGVARRMMEALGNSGVNVILTSQGSSEHSITVAVDERDGELASQSVRQAFELELARNAETQVTTQPGCSIVAVIGEGMKSRTNISGRFFSSLGRAKVNIVAIAQGSSERNISVVVHRDDLSRALRASHAGFTLSDMTVALAVIGTGHVGTELLNQISEFQTNPVRVRKAPAMVNVNMLNLEVRATCDVNCMVMAEQGVPLQCFTSNEASCTSSIGGDICDISKWAERVESQGSTLEDALAQASAAGANIEVRDTDLEVMTEFLDTKDVPHKVVIDCTASEKVASMYPAWLRRGLHVISPNKRAGSGSMSLYRECLYKEVGRQMGARWHYESTVGAQMPVISLVRDLIQTGDGIKKIVGVFSGTLSFITNSLHRDPNMKFSDAVAAAQEQGLTEPDAGEDLSGEDTARKALIIARELGMEMELGDVGVENLMPEPLRAGTMPLIAGLRDYADESMALRVREAAERGERLAYVAEVDAETSKVFVGLRSFSPEDPLFALRGAETAVTFTTDRYPSPTPLFVCGLGAGPTVTASGVFADLLRLCVNLGN